MRTYPILLAHGIARFDYLTNRVFQIDNSEVGDNLHYFKGIRTFLEDYGFKVRHTNVSWAGSVKKRAHQLRDQIEKTLQIFGVPKLHVIAHSMGGLDARHALFVFQEERLDSKIASVSTIGTPHHGSPVADAIVQFLGLNDAIDREEDVSADGLEDVLSRRAALRLALVLGIDGDLFERLVRGTARNLSENVSGVLDLTTWACREFNEKAAEFESTLGVYFQAYVGVQRRLTTFSLLKESWGIVNKREGPNDGLVSARSARWSDDYFSGSIWSADHLNQLGWWDPSELWRGRVPWVLERQVKGRYLKIAEGLEARFSI